MNKIEWELPIKTVSEANSSEHWTTKSKRHKQQQFFVRLAFNKYIKDLKFPCEITLTRLAPRLLDCEENLPMSFKWIKDEIGACIFPEKVVNYLMKKRRVVKNKTPAKKCRVVKNKGHADSDPRIKWHYSQEKSPTTAIRVAVVF